MSWTYSGDPNHSQKDAVRFLSQDTDTTSQLASDEEILWVLSEIPNTYLAAAQVARVIASRFTEEASSRSVGQLSVSYAERGTKYLELATSLESQAKKGSGAVIAAYSGGISKADKELIASDDDWVKPWATIGIHDNPGAWLDPALSTST